MVWSRRSRQPMGFVESAFEQYHAGLHRFLMRRLRSTHHAQDLAQETYLRLLRMDHPEMFDASGNFRIEEAQRILRKRAADEESAARAALKRLTEHRTRRSSDAT